MPVKDCETRRTSGELEHDQGIHKRMLLRYMIYPASSTSLPARYMTDGFIIRQKLRRSSAM